MRQTRCRARSISELRRQPRNSPRCASRRARLPRSTRRAASRFDRLAWRNTFELAEYAHSFWAAPPAELLRKQLLRATGEGPGKCTLEIEVQEFTQVFSSRESSEARIEMRVALATGPSRIASLGVTVIEPDAGGEAAAGAKAMARAADRALDVLAAWVAAQSGCR